MTVYGSDPSEVLGRLLTEDVLVEKADGQLSPSDPFIAARERHRADIADGDDSVGEGVTEVLAGEPDPELIAETRALQEFDGSLAGEEAVQVALALRRAVDPPPDSGVPDGFVSVTRQGIGPFLRRHSASVVFCWEPGSAACRAARRNLEAAFEDESIPDAVGLGAVNVPDCPYLLREEFDVWLPPTTLFFSGSTVESRLVRAHPQVSILREFEILSTNLG